MKRLGLLARSAGGFTVVETVMAATATSLVLAGLMAGSIALQRSFVATMAYVTAENAEMPISDYLAVDMRRAIALDTSTPGVVSVTLPSYYLADGTLSPPSIVNTMGWPTKKKKKKKNKHSNIITDQTATYSPASTQLVKYYKGSASTVGTDSSKFYREVGGVAKVIANDVADFSFTISADDTTATTLLTFQPRFHTSGNSTDVTAVTTLSQTTLLRNLQ